MVFQTFKFLVVRAGISLFMMLTLGFFGLYFFHEIALAGVRLNDEALHWLFGGVFVFFGFIGFGMWGEYRFDKALRSLRDLDSQENEKLIIGQYENLITFTWSSYFLPAKARLLRSEAICDYADYLHSIGKDNPTALKIYLKAYLLEPTTSRFRLPLLSALKRVQTLGSAEIDLLLVMFRSAKRPDHAIASHLADLLIKQKRFSRKTESIFLTAVEAATENARAIISFVLPRLLKKNRSDEFAIKFYLSALGYHPIEEERLKVILAIAYCDGLWRAVEPSLHEKCGIVFERLPEAEQERRRQSVRETRVSEKWKRLKLFEAEDFKGLKRLQVRFGFVRTGIEVIKEGSSQIYQVLKDIASQAALTALEGLIAFSRKSPIVKLGSFIGLGVMFGITMGYLISQRALEVRSDALPGQTFPPKFSPQQLFKSDREYTLQVAAVTSGKQADRLVGKLKIKGLKGVYMVKSPRRTGGHWYKIRVGKFNDKLDAYAHGDRLKVKQIIRNYFIISYLPQTP